MLDVNDLRKLKPSYGFSGYMCEAVERWVS